MPCPEAAIVAASGPATHACTQKRLRSKVRLQNGRSQTESDCTVAPSARAAGRLVALPFAPAEDRARCAADECRADGQRSVTAETCHHASNELRHAERGDTVVDAVVSRWRRRLLLRRRENSRAFRSRRVEREACGVTLDRAIDSVRRNRVVGFQVTAVVRIRPRGG